MFKTKIDVGLMCSFLLAFLAASATVAPGGPSIASVLMLLAGLICVTKWRLSTETKTHLLVAVLFYTFMSGITSFYFDGWKIADVPGRYLLAIPFALLLSYRRLRANIILNGFVVGAILSGLVSLYQVFVEGMGRSTGSIFIIYFGILTVVQASVSLCAMLFHKDNNKLWFWLSASGVVLGLLAAVLSGVRGAWTGIIPAFLLFFILSNKKLTIGKLMTAGIAGLVVCILAYNSSSVVQQRTDAVFDNIYAYQQGSKNTSVGLRFEMWRAAVREFQQSPVIGLGFTRRGEYREQLIDEGYLVSSDGSGSAHNEFFDALSKRGLLGVLAILMLYMVPAWIFLRQFLHSKSKEQKAVSIAGLCMVTVYVMAGLTERFLFHHTGAMFYAFLISGLWVLTMQGEEMPERRVVETIDVAKKEPEASTAGRPEPKESSSTDKQDKEVRSQ